MEIPKTNKTSMKTSTIEWMKTNSKTYIIQDTGQDDNPTQHPLQEDEVKGDKEANRDNEDEGTVVISEQESDLQGSS
jgi:hypothetical protein